MRVRRMVLRSSSIKTETSKGELLTKRVRRMVLKYIGMSMEKFNKSIITGIGN
jgi:hypothetical protein